ncbi:MAG TPA: O-antigen ligase family protein [Bryobacteraceae bacterium]
MTSLFPLTHSYRPAAAGIFAARQLKTSELGIGFIAEVALCILPGLVFVRMGALMTGVKIYFLVFLLLLGWHLLTANFTRYFGLIVATIPVLMPLRKLFLFNTLLAVVAVGLVGWAIVSPRIIPDIMRNRILLLLIVLTTSYWWISFLCTGVYFTNLRIMDLTITACVICLLSEEPQVLGAALTGLALSTILIAFALGPYGDRLGIARLGNFQIGNPIEMGLESGLIVLLSVAEGGRWIYTGGVKWIRITIWCGSLLCLLLSTSRGSWLTVSCALMVLYLSVRKERKRIVQYLVLIGIVAFILISSGHGVTVVKFFNKATSSDRTLSQKTTLRSDQWFTAGKILEVSPVIGAGPGQGYHANVEYGGQHFIFHSLYLQFAAETGVVGLTLLFIFLARVLGETRRHLAAAGEVVPLLGAVSFMAIGLSVSGFDPLSGIYLGLALLAGRRQRVHATGYAETHAYSGRYRFTPPPKPFIPSKPFIPAELPGRSSGANL